MPKLLSNLFFSLQFTYNYTQSKEVVSQRIEATLKKSGRFLSEPDIVGHFIDEDSFVFHVPSGAITGGIDYSSTLSGKLIALGNSESSVKIEISSSMAYKIGCVLSILIGCFLLYKGLHNANINGWGWGIAILIGGPLFCNWFASMANETAKDRYSRYINKALMETIAPNTSLLP